MQPKEQTTALELGKMQARKMLSKLGWNVKIDVLWDETKDTAYTDGKKFIALPYKFHGVDLNVKRLSKRGRNLLTALIAHEVCHFLQPLREIARAERATGLNRDIVNVMLDMHGERVIERMFPEFRKHLVFLRRLVWNSYGKKWIAAQTLRGKFIANGKIAPDEAFVSEAGTLSLLARFKTPSQPYAKNAAKNAHTSKGKQLVFAHLLSGIASYSTLPGSHKELSTFIQLFAVTYPELCTPVIRIPNMIKTGSSAQDALEDQRNNGSSDNGEEQDVEESRGELDTMLNEDIPPDVADLVSEAMKVKLLTGKYAKRFPPKKEAILLAARLKVQLNRDKTITKVIAPVNINRRQIATGAVQPWTMDIERGRAIGREITIAMDYSGSMSGIQWQVNVAAQAIAIAVQSDGGKVSAAQFGTECYVDADDSDLPLYTRWRNLGGTKFTFLPYLWRRRATSTIVVITDGQGLTPNPISDKDHDRTHVILLGGGCNPADAALMGHVYPCNSLDDLPKILVAISNKVKS